MAYEFVEEESPSESFTHNLVRQSIRQPYKLATRAVGLPGDIFSLINEYIAKPATEFIWQKPVSYEETYLGKAFPTTETHRKGVEEITGEYLQPQNDVERFADDLIEDTALLMIPGGRSAKTGSYLKKQATKGAMALPKKFTIALGANTVKQAIKDSGGTEDAQTWGKMGSLLFLSMFDKRSAAEQLGNLYKEAEKNLPEQASINASRLEDNISNLKSKIIKGRPEKHLAPSEKFVIDEIGKLEDLIKDGKANVSQLWAAKRSLNENLGKQLFETPTKESQGRAKNLAKQLSNWLSKEIKSYGEKNPQFGKPFQEAEEGFGTLAQSNFVTRWIDNNLRYSPLTQGLMHFLGSQAGAAIGTAVAPYQTAKIGYRIAKSKVLRDHYLNVLKSATNENVYLFNKELQKLDVELQKEESEDKWEFID